MTSPVTKPKPDIARAERAIAELARAYPSVTLDHPWGHSAFKVRGKTFLFLSADAEGLSLSVKLPHSGSAALVLPFAEPTHYGLGKSGWVTARFKVAKSVPLPLLGEWLDESYRAIAPKKLAAELDAAKRPAKPNPKSKSKPKQKSKTGAKKR
jgi:predicted DNA-binding protein (MmcQ/YjbR family)